MKQHQREGWEIIIKIDANRNMETINEAYLNSYKYLLHRYHVWKIWCRNKISNSDHRVRTNWFHTIFYNHFLLYHPIWYHSFIDIYISEHRRLLLDINLSKLLRNTSIDKTNTNIRKIETLIQSNIKKYNDIVEIHMNKRKVLKKKENEEKKEISLIINDMSHIQYIDKYITEIVLLAEKKLRNKKGK